MGLKHWHQHHVSSCLIWFTKRKFDLQNKKFPLGVQHQMEQGAELPEEKIFEVLRAILSQGWCCPTGPWFLEQGGHRQTWSWDFTPGNSRNFCKRWFRYSKVSLANTTTEAALRVSSRANAYKDKPSTTNEGIGWWGGGKNNFQSIFAFRIKHSSHSSLSWGVLIISPCASEEFSSVLTSGDQSTLSADAGSASVNWEVIVLLLYQISNRMWESGTVLL